MFMKLKKLSITKIFIIFFLIIINFKSVAVSSTSFQEQTINITKNLRCLICQGQSVYDSDSEFAISLKLVIKNKIQQGLSEEQIYSFLKMKYGEWILYDPVFNRNTYFLWLLPILIFLAGGAIIIKRFYNKK